MTSVAETYIHFEALDPNIESSDNDLYSYYRNINTDKDSIIFNNTAFEDIEKPNANHKYLDKKIN
ncbi:hypothetical protein VTO42DRAFT_7010 [Malbranchea cinnamomea]